jgi:hypothetical protein
MSSKVPFRPERSDVHAIGTGAGVMITRVGVVCIMGCSCVGVRATSHRRHRSSYDIYKRKCTLYVSCSCNRLLPRLVT